MESVFGALLIAIFVAVITLAICWRFSRSRSLLEQWATQNGYKILKSENRNIFRGPYFLRSSEGQTVYYVKIQDTTGRIRSGWIRCGGWWAGLFTNKVDVKWED